MCSGGFPACALALAVLANFLFAHQTKSLLAHIFPLFKRVSRGFLEMPQAVLLRLRTACREGPLHDQCTARSFGLVAARVRLRAVGTFGLLAPHPALPADTHECRLSRHPQPALLAKRRESAGTSVRNPSPLPALLAGTHKCRLARRTSDWSFFWGSLSRRLALSLGLIHTIRSQLAPHSPIGRSHCLFPEDMTSTIPEFSPAVSRLAFHNTEASRTQHTHPIKERRGRQRGSCNMHLDEAPLQSTRP